MATHSGNNVLSAVRLSLLSHKSKPKAFFQVKRGGGVHLPHTLWIRAENPVKEHMGKMERTVRDESRCATIGG